MVLRVAIGLTVLWTWAGSALASFDTSETRGLNGLALTLRSIVMGARAVQGTEQAIAMRGFKLLVIEGTVRNRAGHAVEFGKQTCRPEVITMEGHRFVGTLLTVNGSAASVEGIQLRSGQSANFGAIIQVPNSVRTGTLQFRYGIGGEVRYNLQRLLRPMSGKGVTPDGFGVLDDADTTLGAVAPLGIYDASADKAEISPQSLYYGMSIGPRESQYVVWVTLRNRGVLPVVISTSTLLPSLLDGTGSEFLWDGFVLHATRSEPANETLMPGQSVTVRYLFRIPRGTRVRTVRIRDAQSSYRSIVVRL